MEVARLAVSGLFRLGRPRLNKDIGIEHVWLHTAIRCLEAFAETPIELRPISFSGIATRATPLNVQLPHLHVNPRYRLDCAGLPISPSAVCLGCTLRHSGPSLADCWLRGPVFTSYVMLRDMLSLSNTLST